MPSIPARLTKILHLRRHPVCRHVYFPQGEGRERRIVEKLEARRNVSIPSCPPQYGKLIDKVVTVRIFILPFESHRDRPVSPCIQEYAPQAWEDAPQSPVQRGRLGGLPRGKEKKTALHAISKAHVDWVDIIDFSPGEVRRNTPRLSWGCDGTSEPVIFWRPCYAASNLTLERSEGSQPILPP